MQQQFNISQLINELATCRPKSENILAECEINSSITLDPKVSLRESMVRKNGKKKIFNKFNNRIDGYKGKLLMNRKKSRLLQGEYCHILSG